ncbi:molecular chaperone TorD family protein [Bacillus sp. F56]
MSESAGIQKAYEDYTRLFTGPNSLTAPLWEGIYLNREH